MLSSCVVLCCVLDHFQSEDINKTSRQQDIISSQRVSLTHKGAENEWTSSHRQIQQTGLQAASTTAGLRVCAPGTRRDVATKDVANAEPVVPVFHAELLIPVADGVVVVRFLVLDRATADPASLPPALRPRVRGIGLKDPSAGTHKGDAGLSSVSQGRGGRSVQASSSSSQVHAACACL